MYEVTVIKGDEVCSVDRMLNVTLFDKYGEYLSPAVLNLVEQGSCVTIYLGVEKVIIKVLE